MTTAFDDETLMAFADGRLDEPMLSAVADAVEADPELAARVEALVTGAEAARALYGPLDRPVPDELARRVRTMVDDAAGRRADAARAEGTVVAFPAARAAAARRDAWMPQAMAAGLAALVFGAAGYWIGVERGPGPSGVAALALPAAVLDVADRIASGGAGALPDGTPVTVVASFDDAAGRFCREIDVGGADPYVTVVCRAETGWHVELVVAAIARDGGFQPASASGAIDAILQEIGAGSPLTPEEEAARLRSD